jgi:hypothetical protein
MAERRIDTPAPKSFFALEEGPELDAALAEGFPIYQNGVEIDRYFPLQQPPIDERTLPEATRHALALAGAWSDLDWEETEAELERIDRESTSSPPPYDFDW